jgi:hypothetical protein
LSDQKKVTKEKSPADENCLKLFSLYGKRTHPAAAGFKQLFPCFNCSNNSRDCYRSQTAIFKGGASEALKQPYDTKHIINYTFPLL